MMTPKKKTPARYTKILRLAAFSAACTLAAFVLGIQTAGDVHPFSQSEAAVENGVSHTVKKGDLNGNGVVDAHDAITILNFIQDFETPSPEEFQASDMNGDLRITLEDVRRALLLIAHR